MEQIYVITDRYGEEFIAHSFREARSFQAKTPFSQMIMRDNYLTEQEEAIVSRYTKTDGPHLYEEWYGVLQQDRR